MSFIYTLCISASASSIIKGAKNIYNHSTKCRCITTSIISLNIRNDDTSVNIFDRNTKNLQRERAAVATDVNLYDYLKDEIGYRLADRVFDIKRKFKLAADIGSFAGVVQNINFCT